MVHGGLSGGARALSGSWSPIRRRERAFIGSCLALGTLQLAICNTYFATCTWFRRPGVKAPRRWTRARSRRRTRRWCASPRRLPRSSKSRREDHLSRRAPSPPNPRASRPRRPRAPPAGRAPRRRPPEALDLRIRPVHLDGEEGRTSVVPRSVVHLAAPILQGPSRRRRTRPRGTGAAERVVVGVCDEERPVRSGPRVQIGRTHNRGRAVVGVVQVPIARGAAGRLDDRVVDRGALDLQPCDGVRVERGDGTQSRRRPWRTCRSRCRGRIELRSRNEAEARRSPSPARSRRAVPCPPCRLDRLIAAPSGCSAAVRGPPRPRHANAFQVWGARRALGDVGRPVAPPCRRSYIASGPATAPRAILPQSVPSCAIGARGAPRGRAGEPPAPGRDRPEPGAVIEERLAASHGVGHLAYDLGAPVDRRMKSDALVVARPDEGNAGSIMARAARRRARRTRRGRPRTPPGVRLDDGHGSSRSGGAPPGATARRRGRRPATRPASSPRWRAPSCGSWAGRARRGRRARPACPADPSRPRAKSMPASMATSSSTLRAAIPWPPSRIPRPRVT